VADVRPFRALRPRDDLAGAVIAPPYDVLTDAEARAIAAERASFVRVTRSEVDLPAGADAHSHAAYVQARRTLDHFVETGVLVEDEAATYYFYGQTMTSPVWGTHSQTGVLAACSVAEYLTTAASAKHEHTRPDKEDDRTHHMDVLDAQVGLVFLAYQGHDGPATRSPPTSRPMPPRWRGRDRRGRRRAPRCGPRPPTASTPPTSAPRSPKLKTLYIADGHHRSAAAGARSTSAAPRRVRRRTFLAGLYPADPPPRAAVPSARGQGPQRAQRLPRSARPSPTIGFDVHRRAVPDRPAADRRGLFTMYLGGRWLGRSQPKRRAS
jgi:hypothetical protein